MTISLRHKLWLGFGGLLAILLAVGVLCIAVLTRYSHTFERVFHENYDSAVYCNGMKDALDQLNARAAYVVAWPDDPAARAIDVAHQQAQFEGNLHRQLGNCFLPGELESSRALASLYDEFMVRYRRLADGGGVRDAAAAAQARLHVYRDELIPRFDQMQQLIQHIADMNINNMASVDGQVKGTLWSVRNWLTVLLVVGMILAALVVWAAGTAVLGALRTVIRSAHQIEAGDLDLQLVVSTRDEIGQIAAALNSMASRLREFRRLDHDRLVRTQQTTQLAIDSLPDAVFVIGPEQRVEISNRTARTHFHVEPGKSIGDLGLAWLTPIYQAVLRERGPIEPQGYKSAIQLFDDGEERFLLPRAVPMLADDNGQDVIGVTVILVDVTQLRRVDEAKSSVISTVSHELRTPLTGVRMSLSLLASDNFGPVSPNQRRLITASREDGDRLYRIIENLLNISRIESGRSQFQFRSMKPADIVAQALDPLRATFTEKNIRLDASVPTELPEVTADAMSIGLALTNLLTNAIKFTPVGGDVRISCERAANDNGTGGVTFRVADSGPGIPPQYRGRIFEKFFRIPGDSGSTGAGLGLTIAKEIIDAHGGQIGFACPPSGGSVFEFTLPAQAAPVTATAARQM